MALRGKPLKRVRTTGVVTLLMEMAEMSNLNWPCCESDIETFY